VANDDGVESVVRLELFLPAPEPGRVVVAQGTRVDALIGNHDELGEVDRVHAFSQNATLPTTLSVGLEEGASVLEVIAGHDGAEGLPGKRRESIFGAGC
jgi:hypothetical protein